jgi:tetratricopeptide (TPR) repeat protein
MNTRSQIVPDKAQDDELVMSLVEKALAQPLDEREYYLQSACGGNTELFSQVWSYVESEQRMHGFLMEPLCPPAVPEHPFEPGEVLEGRFLIVREVARGGMGIVYEARDEKLERRIAIKCAKTGFGKRLPPEVRHASEISHPNVCKIFEIHTVPTAHGEIDFITMEFLDGETLSERLHRGRPAQHEAREIARQLAAGLAEAHRDQVVHGDLKSNNIILTTAADGSVRAVITDFGLAQRPSASQASAVPDARGGTPDYMAPELWKGGMASTASDVYALGVILCELATGRKPFSTPESPDERGARKPPTLHNKWDRVLARCLDPDPARRFRTAGEVAKALAPSTSRRWILAGVAAAFLAIVTGVVTYRRASGPKESWKLAMLPIESGAGIKEMAERLSRDTAGQLDRLTGGSLARLSISPFDEIERRHIDSTEKAGAALGATHVLHATLANRDDGKLVVRAVLTDARKGINGKEWTADYSTGEVRYAPLALAGMVTSQLGLPPLIVGATVNSAAARDYWSGLWYMRRNSTMDAALPLLERAVAQDPDSPLAYAALAEAQHWKWFVTKEAAWLERAKGSEREAQRRNPDLAQVHRVAGLLGVRQSLYELAASESLRAVALEPNDGEAHRVLGQAYEGLNRLDEALAEYRKAVKLNPGDYRNTWQLGTFYYRRADYGEALPHYLKMVELAPKEPAAHYVLGTDYFSLGRLPEAEHELGTSIRLGETPDELHNLGAVLMEEGKYGEAAANILRALTLGREQVLWRMNLGTIYRLMGRNTESEHAYRRALELAEKEIARDPRDGRTRSHLAFICARLGYSTRAESEIAQAQAQLPDDARVRFMSAATFEALGHRDDTLKLLSSFSSSELADVNRWPDMADLSRDSRFLQLLASRQTK